MRKYKRVIFAEGNGITRAPMAAEIFKSILKDDVEVLSRGLVVHFPEPLNQKAEAVMISNGIDIPDFESQKLMASDITLDTVVFTMEAASYARILKTIETANEENTFILTDYVGEELPIMNPFGGTLQTYGICFEMLKTTLGRLHDMLFGDDQEADN